MGRPSARPLTLPTASALLLAATGAFPLMRENATLFWSIQGAAAALLVWTAALVPAAHRRPLTFDVSIRKQHYMQVFAQASIYIYWGWYWREVYHSAPLFVAQLFFAYAFDSLLAWSRRDTYTLGFGPFPIVLSTNLFLWFKPDWFYFQFGLLAVGFAGKELIRWTKEGRRTHIFNPSSFSLALVSVALIAFHATGTTWGPDIAATQARPPYIYELIALVSLPAQLLFGVASMTWAAVGTTYGFCVAYFAATGTHYFAEQPIPIAVFFGMHLLFTDPSTAPRTDLGRVMFGILYGASVLLVVDALTVMHLPSFYDKLLSVPILNLMIQRLDAAARSPVLKRFDPAEFLRNRPAVKNGVFATLSVATLVAMLAMTGTHTALMRADTLLAEGNLQDALAQYREFVRTDPQEAEGHDKLGVALMQAHQFDEAAASFERSLQLEPDNPKAQDNLGVALMQTGRIDDATAALERAAVLQPDNVKTQNNLGVVLMRSGKYDAAVRALQHAVQVEPMNPEAHDNLGQALLLAGQTEAGVQSLQRAVALEPENVDARDNLGVALMRAGRFSEAAATLERAVQLQPKSAEARDNLGQALLQEGKLKEATESFQAAVAIRPDYADAHFNLAQAFAMANDKTSAVRELHEALRTQPNWPLALETLARLEGTEAASNTRQP